MKQEKQKLFQDLEDLKQKNIDIVMQLQSQQAENKTQQNAISSMQSVLDNLEENKHFMVSQQNALNSKIRDVSLQNQQLMADSKILKQEIEDLEEESQNYQEKYKLQKQNYEQVNEKYNKLLPEYEDLKQQKDTLYQMTQDMTPRPQFHPNFTEIIEKLEQENTNIEEKFSEQVRTNDRLNWLQNSLTEKHIPLNSPSKYKRKQKDSKTQIVGQGGKPLGKKNSLLKFASNVSKSTAQGGGLNKLLSSASPTKKNQSPMKQRQSLIGQSLIQVQKMNESSEKNGNISLQSNVLEQSIIKEEITLESNQQDKGLKLNSMMSSQKKN